VKKGKTYKVLLKDLDSVYSKWLRQSAADENGYVKCYTCKAIKHFKEMQCSHYHSRRILSTRFYEKNTKPACVKCNIFKEGNKPAYALALIKEYGKGILEELDSLSKISVKYNRNKLSNMIFYYKEKLKCGETSAYNGL